MRVLVTGGAGFIGSHAVLALLREGFEVCVVDNYSTGSKAALEQVSRLANRKFQVCNIDVREEAELRAVFSSFRPSAVIHFAGLKAVAESVQEPLRYYENNVSGSIVLLKVMSEYGCAKLIFSSSATVYGDALYTPIDETHPVSPSNPYGRTKRFVEEMIEDWVIGASESRMSVSLRYFNPVGADVSGLIGEAPLGVPNNLAPYIAQVALGKRASVKVFGRDYPTRDGTGERDYIHVSDLADVHIAALKFSASRVGSEVFNVGTGSSTTVLELIKEFGNALGRQITYDFVDRRPGDVAVSFADVSKAEKLLGWRSKHALYDMCKSALKWQQKNLSD